MKYINYNWFGTISDHCLDISSEEYEKAGVSILHNKCLVPENVKNDDIVFVKTDFIYYGIFQELFLPKIQEDFTLISAVSSLDVLRGADISPILSNPFLKKWYCTNAPAISEKIIPIPIGFEEKERVGGDQQEIDKWQQTHKPFKDKKDKVLLPFHTASTNKERANLLSVLSSLSFVDVQTDKLSFSEYLKLLNEYKFVICLEGAGQDLHRFYETLLVGALPIAINNSITNLFSYWKVPGIFLNSWQDLNSQVLKSSMDFSNVDSFLKIKQYADIITQ